MTSNTSPHVAPYVVNKRHFELLEEYRSCLSQRRSSESPAFDSAVSAAKHFLLWGQLEGLKLESIDESSLLKFRDHDCNCFATRNCGPLRNDKVRLGVLTTKRARRFVQFLEDNGRTIHLNELPSSNRHLDEFIGEMLALGYRPGSVSRYRNAAQHFLIWLHRWRIPIGSANSDTVDRFLDHDCLCPTFGRTPNMHGRPRKYANALRKFVNFLVRHGVVDEFSERSGSEPSEHLEDYRSWLEHTRGICASTIRRHADIAALVLEDLGLDASRYDAELIRDVLLRRTQGRPLTYTKHMASSLRMYLRYLALKGACPAHLVNAVIGPRRWRLSTLPRYISSEEVERVIASCDCSTAVGVRDRAVLLLLARLGLRSGDVSQLLLSHIDWKNAQVHVSGKSKRPAILPLPQDVGDALLHYIGTVRPQVDSGRVFVRLMAPHTPFTSSSAVSTIVLRALVRAGVESAGCRGGHLFRHSLATHMLRSGASLDAIGALLRHESVETTRIYAKTDVPMLQEIAQPWLGGAR